MSPLAPGIHPLALDQVRDGLIYIPKSYEADRPSPLVVMLHGAGGSARQGLEPFLALADETRLILLAIQSRSDTWDVIRGGFGPDIAFLDAALGQTFSRYSIDPERVAVEGFSDGGSYALSVGLTNGDLFRHIIAFSPGFAAPADGHGSPRIFISHGVRDSVLPIDRTSRLIVPRLEHGDYDVTYLEFDSGHSVPTVIADQAVAWFLER